jgi:hypothetical protein
MFKYALVIMDFCVYYVYFPTLSGIVHLDFNSKYWNCTLFSCRSVILFSQVNDLLFIYKEYVFLGAIF